jgi:hypothetical protein
MGFFSGSCFEESGWAAFWDCWDCSAIQRAV